MLVDADKVKKKLAKAVESFTLVDERDNRSIYWAYDIIRQADLSDCAVDDVVPRSRLNAVDAELSEEKTAREFQFRAYKAELESQAAEIERLKDALEREVAALITERDDAHAKLALAAEDAAGLEELLRSRQSGHSAATNALAKEMERTKSLQVHLIDANTELSAGWQALGEAMAPGTDHIYDSIRQLAEDRDAERKRAETAEAERDELQKRIGYTAVPLATGGANTHAPRCSGCETPINEDCHGPNFGCIAADHSALSNAAVQANIFAITQALATANEQVVFLSEELDAAKRALAELVNYDKTFPDVLSGDVPARLNMLMATVRAALAAKSTEQTEEG